MAKCREILTIGKEDFVVRHASVNDFALHNHFRDIDDCYQRCSSAKHSIYHYWEDFFRAEHWDTLTYCYNSGVSSYNCMMFTYGADCDIIYNDEYHRASFYITKTRQEVTIYDL